MLKKNFINLNKVKFNASFPDESTIVTYTENNTPLSFFTDDIWDFSKYISSYTQTTIINFSIEDKLSDKSKFYLKLCLYFYIYQGVNNTSALSFRTIIGKYRMLRRLALLCEEFNSDFANIENNRFCLNAIIDSISFDTKANIGKNLNIFELVNKTGYFYEIEGFGFSKESLNIVRTIESKAIDSIKQTPLIPTKILADFMQKTTDFFDEFQLIKNQLLEFFSNERFYRRAASGGISVPFKQLKIPDELRAYFKKYSLTTRSHIISHFLYIQSLGSAYISCFSGMRKNELSSLPYNCLEVIENNIDEKKIYILNGYTNKLTKIGIKSCSWVTSKQVLPVLDTLQTIAKIHKIVIDIGYIKAECKDIPLEKYPLLPIFNQQNHEVGVHPLYKFPTLATATLSQNIYKIIEPILFEESDLEELTNFNLLVDWESEYDLVVGESWQLNYHQFRRSLAVYCSRSSIVKLSTLKKQLKHISFDMTLWYSNNFHNAKKINMEKDFINEYQTEQELFKFNSFCEKVVDNSSTLFGAKGTNYELVRNSNDIPVFFTDRKKLQKYVKENRLSYKKTPLGGCAKIGQCNKLSFAYATACVTCSEAIFDDDSVIALNKAKANYLSQLAKFEEDSISYKQFLIEIEAIDNVLAKRSVLENRNV
ncbi:hypothetical protein [Acinetobacter sp. YH12233]|uniref:hypothetical protein n=1 Tax=Acinetobacter sp. YH12233 TaxID=2601161 RepID=UPI0015D1E873|nr:hypothetical protein [Acinetobacter sp. YH12233]